ncbi:hypothetical protein GGU10DRAFT_381324 [Lentinula aff. detonsa]|uniref:Uncharacterized protein n=1 Tax=Lentinula aff. detonsa TaxID=2804958 RepID=A0AA38K7J1_9AGAR|nr:hypothetical protein GGU10DRAFT_381324 [Lentinula aff. detonsa]
MSSSPEVQDMTSNIPLPVCFIEKGKYILMGTSKGYAAILHTKHGRKLMSLDHGNADRTWVTALAYVQTPKKLQLIATGDGNCGADTKIKVWVEDTEAMGAMSLLKGWSLPLTNLLHFLMRVSYHVFAVTGLAAIIVLLLPDMHVDIQQSLATLFGSGSGPHQHPLPTYFEHASASSKLASVSNALPHIYTLPPPLSSPDRTTLATTITISAQTRVPPTTDSVSSATQSSDKQRVWDRIFDL